MRLVTDYPWYVSLLCLLAGAVYALLLYWLPPHRKRPHHYWWLSMLRCLSVAIIAFLLVAPLIKRQQHERQKPIVIVAQDNSQSIALSGDTATLRNDYARRMADMIATLKKDYDVSTYLFGTSVRQGNEPDYADRSSNISEALDQLTQQHYGRNIGALILASDGLYNSGQNPTSVAMSAFPIYTIGLGDTTMRRDAAIVDLRYNRVAYMGNTFPIEITIRATALAGQRQRLSINHKGRELYAETVDYIGNDFNTTLSTTLPANEEGLQNYTITLSPANDETTLKNNHRNITIEVVDGHQKIAILAAVPHPDIAALRHSIESNKNFVVETFVGDQCNKDSKYWAANYDMLLLHNLPQLNQPFDLRLDDVPVMVVVGQQTDLARLNALHLGIEINSKLDKLVETAAQRNSGFGNFVLDQSTTTTLEHLPPLLSPFGNYKMASSCSPLFYAKIGGITTDQPLIVLSQQAGVRRALVLGEGLWRWRLNDYLENGSHDAFDELTTKMVVYTSLRINKNRFRVAAKSVYADNEPVTLEAEFYDDNFEPTNQPEADITIGNSQYTFARSGNRYRLNAGLLDTGTYTYVATTHFGGHKYTATGHFVVESQNLEETSLVANHALLNTLAQRSGGQLVMPADISLLPQMLSQRDDIKPIIYTHTSYSDLLNLPLIFIIIMLLLTIEWVARKYNGEL